LETGKQEPAKRLTERLLRGAFFVGEKLTASVRLPRRTFACHSLAERTFACQAEKTAASSVGTLRSPLLPPAPSRSLRSCREIPFAQFSSALSSFGCFSSRSRSLSFRRHSCPFAAFHRNPACSGDRTL